MPVQGGTFGHSKSPRPFQKWKGPVLKRSIQSSTLSVGLVWDHHSGHLYGWSEWIRKWLSAVGMAASGLRALRGKGFVPGCSIPGHSFLGNHKSSSVAPIWLKPKIAFSTFPPGFQGISLLFQHIYVNCIFYIFQSKNHFQLNNWLVYFERRRGKGKRQGWGFDGADGRCLNLEVTAPSFSFVRINAYCSKINWENSLRMGKNKGVGGGELTHCGFYIYIYSHTYTQSTNNPWFPSRRNWKKKDSETNALKTPAGEYKVLRVSINTTVVINHN